MAEHEAAPVAPALRSLAPSLDAARDAWEPLAAAAGSPFVTWEWADAWWRTHGDGGELDLRAVDADGGRPAAILPLYRRRRGPLTVARLLGHGAADELVPVCAADDAALAASALRSVAAELPRPGALLVDRLPGDRDVGALLGGRVVREESSPVLPVAGDWEEWLAGRSANLRQQVRRRERKLAREHGLRFRLADDPARLQDDLSLLFDLHRARWDGGRATTWPSPREEAMHRDFAARALERGWLRLWLAEADGRPVTAWYGFRCGGRDWYYQAGRDPAWDRSAVGFVLLVHTIRESFRDGMSEYRFGLGDEAYKERFADADPGLTSVVLGGRAARWAAGTAATLVQRMPAGARRVVSRRAS